MRTPHVLIALTIAMPLPVSAAGAWPSDARPAPAFHALVAATAEAFPDSAATADLGPTHAPPWNPPRVLTGETGWETALRLPGRVVSLPLVALGAATRSGLLVLESSNVVPKLAVVFAAAPTIGLTAAPASLGDHTGTGVTVALVPRPTRRHLRAEWSGSTRKYTRAGVELDAGLAAASYHEEWRPQEHFFGAGMASRTDDEAIFASHARHAGVRLGWPAAAAGSARVRVGAEAGLREAVTRIAHPDGGEARLAEVDPALASALDDQQVEHLVWGLDGTLDGRSGRPHWARGVRVSGSFERFDAPPGELALGGRDRAGARFTRSTVEAEGGASFGRDPRTLRLLVRVTDTHVSAGDAPFLLGDLESLGGSAGLWGYQSRRFQGLDLALARLTYVFPLEQYVELEVHAETGGVYDALSQDLVPRTLKHSFGVALRPRVVKGVLGMVGVDVSPEGSRLRFSIGGVE